MSFTCVVLVLTASLISFLNSADACASAKVGINESWR